MGRRRVDLKEAAELLDSTTEALRKRAKRGTLDFETGEDGRLYVWVDAQVDTQVDTDGDRVDGRVDGGGDRVDGRVDADTSEARDMLIERMGSEIEHLRTQLEEAHEANRENRRIIAGLVQRVPELEASPEPREYDVSASEERGGAEAPPEQETPVSWWRRLFG